MQIRKPFSEHLKERFDFEITDDNYRLAFKSEVEKNFDPNQFGHDMILEELIIGWDDFVADLELGYDMSSYEFDNDMDIWRKPVDLLSNSELLNEFPEHRTTLNIINQIDNRFRRITQEHEKLANLEPWWKKRFLTKASSEYFDTVAVDVTNIQIERTD
ncbi:MAG: hypothetical protein RIC35_20665 [Marinoscillum sp.]